MTKRWMEAELMFDHPQGRDLAVAELAKAGFEIELFGDRVDAHDGLVLSSTVWVSVRGLSDLSDDDFFDLMHALAGRFGGVALEAGPWLPQAVARCGRPPLRPNAEKYVAFVFASDSNGMMGNRDDHLFREDAA